MSADFLDEFVPDAPDAPVRVAKVKAAKVTGPKKARRRLRRSSKQDVADSVRSLAMMLSVSAGELVPVRTMAEQYAGTRLGAAYERVGQQLVDGVPFAQAMAGEETFPPVVRRLVVVGARAGAPAQHLEKAADLLDESAETSAKVRSALLEPTVLGVLIVVFFTAMVAWAVPQMITIFQDTGAPIPPLTQLGLKVAQVAQVLAPVAAVAALVAWGWWRKVGRRSQAVRERVDRWALRVPVIGVLKQEAALAGALSVLGAMVSLGISEREALQTAADGCDNRAIAGHLERHRDALTRGEVTFAELADGTFVPLAVGAVLVAAANAGKLPMGLAHVAATYRRSSRVKADNLSTALSPVANIAVGALFAGAVLIVYLPMYSLFSAITAF